MCPKSIFDACLKELSQLIKEEPDRPILAKDLSPIVDMLVFLKRGE